MPQGSIMSFFKKSVSSACLPHTHCGSFPRPNTDDAVAATPDKVNEKQHQSQSTKRAAVVASAKNGVKPRAIEDEEMPEQGKLSFSSPPPLTTTDGSQSRAGNIAGNPTRSGVTMKMAATKLLGQPQHRHRHQHQKLQTQPALLRLMNRLRNQHALRRKPSLPTAPVPLQDGPNGRRARVCRTGPWPRSPSTTFAQSLN